jgi:beta-lactam-binding protein with PASTA domain/endonuclease I
MKKLLLLLILTTFVFADQWSAPEDYYSGATAGGSTLQSQLQNIMTSGHSVTSYDQFRYISKYFDTDPYNSQNILLSYNRQSVNSGWDSGNTWNREHVWPQSRQGSSDNLGDPHAIRPCDPSVNSSRSNLPFMGETLTGTYGSHGSYFFPGDYDKGDIARSLFYSATRYNMTLVNGYPSGYQMGDLASLIRWNYQDVPDDFERRRNHIIYSDYTNNRNAFIDHPEFVWSVFAGNDNDTKIYLGSSVPSDGASIQTIEVGKVIVGNSPAQVCADVEINKTGNDGTYYQITAEGNITTTAEGKFAFDYGDQTRNITVCIDDVSAETAGINGGTVVIENLDVSSASPYGCGGNDGDDVITAIFTVVEHSTGSFTPEATQAQLNINFGVLDSASNVDPISFDIYNLLSQSGFTADMQIVSVTSQGDTDKLTTDLDSFTGSIPAGSSYTFTANLNNSVSGSFSATYYIQTADEYIPGSADGELLTLTLTALVSGLAGDINNDGDVDLEDILIMAYEWLVSFEHPLCPQADLTGDCFVDYADLSYLFARWLTTENTTVPDLSSLTQAQAEIVLATEGLNGQFSYQYSDSVANGYIISQEPPQGTVLKIGGVASAVVSQGAFPRIPDVIGMNESSAVSLIENSGFTAQLSYAHSDTVPEDSVISQNPLAGTIVALGSTVAMTVSKGPAPNETTVPDLSELTQQQAEQSLLNASLVLGNVTQQYSDDVASGLTISQSPLAGTTVDIGSSVDIAISMGAEPVEPFVVITGIVDGDLSGGNPKAIELYVSGTVNLSNYSVERSANGGAFSSSFSLSGTYTNRFVYLVGTANGGLSQFQSVFGTSGDFANVITSGYVSGNGNDAFRLKQGSSVIDQVAAQSSSYSYQDSYIYRSDNTGPDGGWNAANWTLAGNGALDGKNALQHASTVPFGQYTP